MAHLAVILAVVAALVAPVRAEISIEAGVPFTAAELTAALALRGATVGDIAVRALSPTQVELRSSIGRERVELGAARGAQAARLVALQLAVFAIEPSLAGGPPPPIAAPAGGRSWALGIAGGAGHGAAAIDFALTALRAEATAGLGRWRWGASVAWLHGLAKSPDRSNPATADFCPVRVFAGLAAGGVELVAGPELVAYSVTAASPGVTVGAGAGIRVRLTGGARWQAIASADLSAFRHRVIVERAGMQFAATPQIALTAALGLAWGRL